MAAARGLPIPPPDEIPPELEYKNPPKPAGEKEPSGTNDVQHLTVPITSRSHSYNSDASQPSGATNSLPSAPSPIASGSSSSPLFRTRAKTLAALTTPSKFNTSSELTPREMQLPRDPFVNGQPIEAYLYKDAGECPICFLYYPPYLNRTRCCDQPICSECFVQIKRPEPHPADHAENDPNAPPASEGNNGEESQLVSEPAACPFCVQPELGVTYIPPPFRRGLTYAPDVGGRPNANSAMSSTSSLSSGNIPLTGRRRATSLSASDPAVVTTDKIRPDWAQKLANARAHNARRSAAATALHTAAYMMNSNQSGSDSRSFSLGRRGVMRRTGTPDAQTSPHRGSPALNALTFLTDRRGQGQEGESAEEGTGNLAPPRGSSRRNRVDDLEDMMMMEAIRLSLASEEERRKREEKGMRKEAKRREKDAKKADKAARKNGLYSNNASSSGVDGPADGKAGRVLSSSSSGAGEEASAAGKGKGVERVSPSVATGSADQSSGASSGHVSPVPPTVNETEQDATSTSAQPPGMDPPKRSHLRHMSSASSSLSSLVESTDDRAATGDGNQSMEPMFNFRSLAAVIGDEDKRDESAEHVEHSPEPQTNEGGSSSDTSPPAGQASTNGPDPGKTEATEAGESAQESHTSPMPKELETRSVELTSPASNAEAQS
jgi:hypothetical protein